MYCTLIPACALSQIWQQLQMPPKREMATITRLIKASPQRLGLPVDVLRAAAAAESMLLRLVKAVSLSGAVMVT